MSISNKIELLAPAGGIEQLKTAINFGADAVYLAAHKFGMRAKAANFQLEDISNAVSLAHENNVKVYVTANILMHNREISQLDEFFKALENAGVDAVILSDLGALSIVKKAAPKLEIHVSTQASSSNAESVIQWAKLGARRVVLAREMSLEEIKETRKILDEQGYEDKSENPNAVSLEVFVHGAMCMSVSGRCLISSYLTNRSANKGLCTQPCRWGFNLEEENRPGQKFGIEEDDYGTYIMNSKDMNMLNYLNELYDAGVSSLKIEGRNKKSLYVATVVNAYRHVLNAVYDLSNAKISDEQFNEIKGVWSEELENVSHRPYSTGFYFGEAEQSPDYDGYEQQCVHVADVLNCRKDGDSENYIIKVLCRNRFEEDQNIQALVPGHEIQSLSPKNLKWLPDENSSGKKVDIANRAKGIYEFECESLISEGSLLRSRTYLRTSRI